MKKYIFIFVLSLAVYGFISQSPALSLTNPSFSFLKSELSTSDKALKNAFENKFSNIQVGGSGKVVKVLPDDTQGSQHQRFIIKLKSGQTLLIAHNIDLAPRINSLRVGDHINFYGEYEWNSKGGVVHWTHHDPNGRHEGGWLYHGGKLYQ